MLKWKRKRLYCFKDLVLYHWHRLKIILLKLLVLHQYKADQNLTIQAFFRKNEIHVCPPTEEQIILFPWAFLFLFWLLKETIIRTVLYKALCLSFLYVYLSIFKPSFYLTRLHNNNTVCLTPTGRFFMNFCIPCIHLCI